MGDEGLQVDNEVHELKLGSSFDPRSKVALHSMRYDFKPASVDTTKESTVEVGERNQIKVTVPHVEGAGTDHTIYKGNKRPCLKECVLIIDHQTGTFTLEKLTNNIQLKKTRSESSSKVALSGRPLTPVEVTKQKKSPVKVKNPPAVQISPMSHNNSPSVTPVNVQQDENSKDACPIGEISDDSSSYDSSSDSDSDTENKNMKSSQEKPSQESLFKPFPPPAAKPQTNNIPLFGSSLSEDLRLSESSSDDD